jgi:hypothetical protein
MVFIENVGQFDERILFQARSGNTTLFLTDDALWMSLIEPSANPDAIPEMGMPDGVGTGSGAYRGVNLKLSLVGANTHPRLEPFDEQDAQISFFTGSDPDQWQTHVPAWGGVRYVELYPGVDLEITSQRGQLAQRLVVREPSSLYSMHLRVEGADDLALEGNTLRLVTPLGDLALTLPTVTGAAPEGAHVISKVDGAYHVSAPFTSEDWLDTRTRPTDPAALLYSTYLGGSGDEEACDIAFDDERNIYVAGRTSSPDFPTTPGVYNAPHSAGLSDVFVTKLSADGNTLLYSTVFGGNDEDAGSGITVDSSGNIYITGSTSSTNLPTTPGAMDSTLNGGRDAFVAKLNASGDLLIYGTYLGGNSWEYGIDIAVDGTGDAYVGGFTHGDFPTTPSAFQTTFGGAWDGYVTKLNSDGSALLYSTYLGGLGGDFVSSTAVDETGRVYVSGGAASTNFPTTPGAWDRTCDNCRTDVSEDGFVAKLDTDGSALIYSTLIGGSSTPAYPERFDSIVVDRVGNAYVAGRTTADDFPTTTNALQPGFGGGSRDGIVVKLNADGSALLYSTYLGGSGTDDARNIVIDTMGNAHVTGRTTSTDLPTVDPLQATNSGAYDAFVAKLNRDGSALLYSTYFGGSGDENAYGSEPHHLAGNIALDSLGNIYLIGTTDSADFPTANALQAVFGGGNYDAFVTKLTPSELPPPLVYSTYLGGSCEDRGYDIAVDSLGHVYVTGQIASVDFPTTPGAYDRSNNDSPPGCQINDYTGEAFISKLSADGSTLLYSTYLGGNSEDAGYAITVDGNGNVFLTGKTYSTDFPTTPGALDASLGGGRDAFVAKLNATGDDLVYSTYLGGSSWEYGLDIAVDAQGYAYITGFTHGGFPTTPGVWQPSPGGSIDGFVVKLNLDGSAMVYSTYLGGSSNDGGQSIAVDHNGHAHITGGTHSTDFPTANPLQPAKAGGISDAFVAKLKTDASGLEYSTYLGAGAGGGGGEAGYGIAIDKAGNAYVAGATDATDFPTVAPIQPIYGGGDLDAFLAKIHANGKALVYSTYYGGNGTDRGLGIGIDRAGAAYITGYTSSTDLAIVDPLQAANAGGYDAFLAKVNHAGRALVFSSYLGGSADDNLYGPWQGDAGLAVHSTGKVYLTGLTASRDFPTTPGALSTAFAGGDSDAFVTSLDLGPARGYRYFFPVITGPWH